MKLTNNLRLPDAIVRAVANDTYTKGDADFSVTQLLQPPQLARLAQLHADEIIEDVSDRIWSLLGQSVHAIIERAADENNTLSELTLTTSLDNYKIKGTIDNITIANAEMCDFKVTTAYKLAANPGVPLDWEQQTNIYRWMLWREKHFEINAIAIIVILRDWSKREAARNINYPQAQVVRLDVPLWDYHTTGAFVAERLALHTMEEPPPCSDEDIWARPSKWAVYKKGGARAVRVFDTQEAANHYLENNSVAGGYIEYRPGEAIRCESYCPVSSFCTQRANDPRNKGNSPTGILPTY